MKIVAKTSIKEVLKDNWKVAILYIFLTFISIVLLSRKVDFFVDEMLTYNLANVRDLFNPVCDVTFSPASKPFVEAMASDGKFDLEHIWFQQANDTHPPLYYVFVHAVCCLFPNSVSVRYAGIINIVFMLLTFWVFRKILKLLIPDNTAVYLLSVMFVFSAGILSMITLLRMYVMSMFFITLFTYLIIRNVDKYGIKDFIYLGLVVACGALTHYYCIAYDFFISVCVVVIMLIGKRFKEIGIYAISMAAAGLASYLIFPPMIIHIFNNERGTESMANLANSDFFERFNIYFGIFEHEIFGGILGIIIVLLFFISIALLSGIRENRTSNVNVPASVDKMYIYRYLCVLIPSTCYFLLVAKSAPFFADRYVSPIFAVSLSGVMGIIYLVIRQVVGNENNTRIVFSILVAVIIFLGHKDYEWPYLYRERAGALEAAESYGGSSSNAICVFSNKWMINPHYLEISECGTSTFYKLTDYDTFSERVDKDLFGEKLALFIIGSVDGDFYDRFVEDHPEYTLTCDNGEWGYGHSYYFRKN